MGIILPFFNKDQLIGKVFYFFYIIYWHIVHVRFLYMTHYYQLDIYYLWKLPYIFFKGDGLFSGRSVPDIHVHRCLRTHFCKTIIVSLCSAPESRRNKGQSVIFRDKSHMMRNPSQGQMQRSAFVEHDS